LLPALPGALLPIATAPTQSDDSADVPLEILVVDDNVDAAEALAALLGAWGHTTHLSHDGITALEVARALMLDVVLLDLDLPKIDGFDVASSLRLDRSPEELMLVALSGFGSAQHRERAKAAGFDHHFVKPVDIPALRALLRQRAGRPRAAPSLRTASAAMARG
jgi:CheY-like chemotaxis protein